MSGGDGLVRTFFLVYVWGTWVAQDIFSMYMSRGDFRGISATKATERRLALGDIIFGGHEWIPLAQHILPKYRIWTGVKLDGSVIDIQNLTAQVAIYKLQERHLDIHHFRTPGHFSANIQSSLQLSLCKPVLKGLNPCRISILPDLMQCMCVYLFLFKPACQYFQNHFQIHNLKKFGI